MQISASVVANLPYMRLFLFGSLFICVHKW